MNQFKKILSWEAVRSIANRLTNQIYLGGVDIDISQAHLSDFREGPVRRFVLEKGQTGHWRDASEENAHRPEGWWAFDEINVSQLCWESLSSGSQLRATKLAAGRWELEYIPPVADPAYRGAYFALFEKGEGVENIHPEYAKGTHRWGGSSAHLETITRPPEEGPFSPEEEEDLLAMRRVVKPRQAQE